MFSRRTGWDLAPNALTRALRDLGERGCSYLDLTRSNPTTSGLDYADREILAALSNPRALRYEPVARGLLPAREAIAAYYRDHGVEVDPEHLILTASTSEAYQLLLRLLCDPGDPIAVPEPGYPLLDFLGGLADVELTRYPLSRRGERWRIVCDDMDDDARAIVVIQPHNPTGGTLTGQDRERLVGRAADRGQALIVDEVFLDYAEDARTCAGEDRALTFVTSGLSKVAALPQLKLGWIHVSGPEALRDSALDRLDTMADTYLSVNTPVQWAAPSLLGARGEIVTQIRRRVDGNREWVDRTLKGGPLRRVSEAAGWYAVLEAPIDDEEAFVLDLIQRERVLVHPGFFYDFAQVAGGGSGYLVVSLLGDPDELREGIARLAAAVDQRERSSRLSSGRG